MLAGIKKDCIFAIRNDLVGIMNREYVLNLIEYR
jgi:hypothetical protein